MTTSESRPSSAARTASSWPGRNARNPKCWCREAARSIGPATLAPGAAGPGPDLLVVTALCRSLRSRDAPPTRNCGDQGWWLGGSAHPRAGVRSDEVDTPMGREVHSEATIRPPRRGRQARRPLPPLSTPAARVGMRMNASARVPRSARRACGHGLEPELPARSKRLLQREVAGEARIAMRIARCLDGLVHALQRQIAERIRTELLRDLVH